MGLYRDTGKENKSYYLGFRVWGLGFPQIRGTFQGGFRGHIGLHRI